MGDDKKLLCTKLCQIFVCLVVNTYEQKIKYRTKLINNPEYTNDHKILLRRFCNYHSAMICELPTVCLYVCPL